MLSEAMSRNRENIYLSLPRKANLIEAIHRRPHTRRCTQVHIKHLILGLSRGEGREREGGGDGERDSVRHKHIETETKLMDGWGKTGVSEELNELCICTPALIHRTIHALACVRVPYAGADVKMNTARSAPMQHSTVRRRSSHSPTCVWVSARGFSIIQPRELAWGGETRVGNGIPRAVVSIRKRLIGCQMCDFPREGWRFKISPGTAVKVRMCVFHTCRLGSDEEMCLSLRHLEHLCIWLGKFNEDRLVIFSKKRMYFRVELQAAKMQLRNPVTEWSFWTPLYRNFRLVQTIN